MSNFNKLTPEIADQIKALAGESRFATGNAVKPDFAHDEKSMYGTSIPEATVEVVSTEEVAAIMKICNANSIPVTVRGAGTGLCGGSVAIAGGLVLCTARMKDIVCVDEENMTITVQPGALLQDVIDAANAHSLYYPPDPGEKTASIGGNVNTNAGGPRAMGYGTTRDYVLAVTAVLPTGEIVKLGNPVVKSSNGLNMLQLVVGSEGTLAIVTEITLKLIPKKRYDISFIVPYGTFEEAMSAAIVFKKSGLDPVSMEIMTREIVEFSSAFTGEKVFPAEGDANLLITFESNSDDSLDMLMEQFAEVAEETGPIDILVVDTPTLKKSVLAAHAAFQTSIESGLKRFDESDVVLPMSKVAEYVESVKGTADELGMNVQLYGHAGDGSLHIFVYNDALSAEAFAEKNEAFMETTYAKCAELGGVISGEHGIGHGKKAYLESALGDSEMELMRNIKKAFDPKGILNPGKVM